MSSAAHFRTRRGAVARHAGAALAAAISMLAFPLAPVSTAASPDVVLSEVYGGGGNTGAPYANDFVELYNRGSATVDLSGWSVQYASRSGTNWLVTQLSGSMEPGSKYLVQLAAGTGGNGDSLPTPEATGTTNMSLSSGKVALVTGTSALSCGSDCDAAPGVRDFVGYGSANDFETAPAPTLSNTTSATRSPATSDTDDNAADFAETSPTPENSGGSGGGGSSCDTIESIQGAAHISPCDSRSVSGIRGVVTAVDASGFWFQDTSPDTADATSAGMFVYTSVAPTVSVGDDVSVNGTVSEYRPGGSAADNLTITELTNPSVSTLGTAALPAPVVIGTGGRVPPTTVIDDDASGSVETSGTFDADTDGIDFYESMEGMRVELNNPVAAGPTSKYGEIAVLGDDGSNASVRSPRGGIVLRETDPNPERLLLDDRVTSGATPQVDTGDHFSTDAVGVLDYSFGNFRLQLANALTSVSGSLQREVTDAAGAGEVSVATMNVENLDANDPQGKFDALAGQLVTNLKAPDIVALAEIQDNNGALAGSPDADRTWSKLIDAVSAAGGPAYDYRQIDPQNGADGGEPGGNIRVGFLFRTDHVTFAPGPHGDATTAVAVSNSGDPADPVELSLNPGRIAPSNSAFDNSRKPLVAKFYANGEPLIVVANHFASKYGDNPLFGRWQPPQQSSLAKRVAQARAIADFYGEIEAVDADARVVVAGDLNDFEYSDTVNTLVAAGLTDLPATLPGPERYTYNYRGNSQVLDHLLLSPAQAGAGYTVDVVHTNSEFASRPTDHDPLVARLAVP